MTATEAVTRSPWIEPLPAEGVRLIVHGTPQSQGSHVPFVDKRSGKARLKPSGGAALGQWRHDIAAEAARLAYTYGTLGGYLDVSCEFRLRMPKSRPAPVRRVGLWMANVRPDGDKLQRAVWDALTAGGLIEDDARISRWSGCKREVATGWVGVLVHVRRDRVEGVELS